MGRRIVSLILITLTVFLCLGCTNKLSIDDCFNCVYSLTCSAESRYDSMGTAFLISETQLLTNAHVISYFEDGEKVVFSKIVAIPYNSNDEIELVVEFVDFSKDYAILKYANSSKKSRIFLEIGDSSDLKVGDYLSTIGNLNNYGLCYNDGILSSYKKTIYNNNEYNDYFQTNIEISKGSSGGPVLNSKNQVVGIMTFKLRDTNSEYVDGMSFFLPIENVKL